MSDRLLELCRQLKLGQIAALAKQVEYMDRKQYITGLLELVLKQAGFPSPNTKEYIPALDFIPAKENLLLLGVVGTGKPYLATALGIKACLSGKKVAFYRTANLTNELVERHERGQLSRFLRSLSQKDLLILDEVGYIPSSKKASELLFSLISNAYESKSIITTSNLKLGRWNEVFGDDRLTNAIIDRLIHHSHILAFAGESFRFKQALERRNFVR
ncbi:MAG: ATP-binding protein [Peptococcaceae bacterium]|nr:ATP-binding protein [Peptococcaceae bacterium]